VHCIFVGFKNEFKGQGYATQLLQNCSEEARREQMGGVAVVTRKGSFIVQREIFIKNGFVAVDKAEPDFELLAIKFDQAVTNPSFRQFSA